MDRKKMIDRVKALLAKTIANGCSEAEAMAALAKAKSIMDEHEIAEHDVTFGGEEVLRGEHKHKTRNKVPNWLSPSVARFCGCKRWIRKGRRESEVVFFGLESDVMMAKWLLATLTDFVMRETRAYMKTRILILSEDKTKAKNGFQMGCVVRLEERLRELSPIAEPATASHGTPGALVVLKNAMVEEAYGKLGLELAKPRKSRMKGSEAALLAGFKAADSATIARPVEGGAAPLMIGRAV